VEVRRFLWWQDEASAVEEEEVEVERRMAAKRRKRSVAELFAAVPLVPRGRDGGQQGSGKGKKAAKRKADKDKGKLVLAVSVKTKKKKEVPAGPGIDVREKVAHCIASTVDLLSISGITILSGTVECLYSPACTGLPELVRYKWILLFS